MHCILDCRSNTFWCLSPAKVFFFFFKCACEVQQLLGNDQDRAIAMSATDGVMRGMVIDTWAPISVAFGLLRLEARHLYCSPATPFLRFRQLTFCSPLLRQSLLPFFPPWLLRCFSSQSCLLPDMDFFFGGVGVCTIFVGVPPLFSTRRELLCASLCCGYAQLLEDYILLSYSFAGLDLFFVLLVRGNSRMILSISVFFLIMIRLFRQDSTYCVGCFSLGKQLKKKLMLYVLLVYLSSSPCFESKEILL